jgi:hypothetical protein
MKANSIKLALLITVMSCSFIHAQVKQPGFYTDGGTTEATSELDCATLKDLLVKTPIPTSALKYDLVEFAIEINTHNVSFGESNEIKFNYIISLPQKKFDIQYTGKNEATFWLVNPKTGKGDFEEMVMADVCGNTPKDKITITFTFMGYIKTSDKQSYSEYNKTWETIPVYDEGTSMGTATIDVKQTDENKKSFKKRKLKNALGGF